jgi:hypothetical protein
LSDSTRHIFAFAVICFVEWCAVFVLSLLVLSLVVLSLAMLSLVVFVFGCFVFGCFVIRMLWNASMLISFRHSVRESWDRRDPDLMGRFDFLWDGEGVPKMAGRLEVLARISCVRAFVTHTATNYRPLGLNMVA